MRTRIREEVALIQPLDDTEREHIADALAWIDSGAELCRIEKPAVPPKHLVSYVAVLDGDHILLADHRNAGLWLPMGGHVERGEHPRAAAAREVQEELGLAADMPIDPPLMITCTTTVGLTAGHTDVSLWYVLRGSRQVSLQFDAAEFNSVHWFPLSEVPLDRSDPHMHRFLAKLAARGSAGTWSALPHPL
ncbi:MAG: NUDIX hydrolase [Bacteroidetes bacterium]|nr:NUDIX hydrolase [Bacteroidota bacterium]